MTLVGLLILGALIALCVLLMSASHTPRAGPRLLAWAAPPPRGRMTVDSGANASRIYANYSPCAGLQVQSAPCTGVGWWPLLPHVLGLAL